MVISYSMHSGLSFCLAVLLQHSIQVLSINKDLARIQHSSPSTMEFWPCWFEGKEAV